MMLEEEDKTPAAPKHAIHGQKENQPHQTEDVRLAAAVAIDEDPESSYSPPNRNNGTEHESSNDPETAETIPYVSPALHEQEAFLTFASETPPTLQFLSSRSGYMTSGTPFLEQALFFGCGLGTSICYIATLSSLVYFKLLYGADSFVYLNLAVFLPLLPISMAQARWDQYYDLQYQSRKTFIVRGVVGFVLGLVGTLEMIRGHYHGSTSRLADLVFHAMLQGTGGAILYGTMNQLASFVGSEDGRKLKTAVSAGVQASALLVLVVSVYTGFGVHNAARFPLFLWNIMAIEFICFGFFLWLLLARPTVAVAMVQRDSALRLDEDGMDEDASMGTPLLMAPPSAAQERQPPAVELTSYQLLQRSASCCVILVVALVPSFLVGSWFTRVQTNWMALASWLFYIRIGSDFLGRLATIFVPPRTMSCLSWTCILRLLPVGFFFLNANENTQFYGGRAADFLSIVLVAIIAFFSGYLVTGCFQLAPMGLELQNRQANAAKQASLLTVAFAVSAIGGLVSSFIFMALGV